MSRTKTTVQVVSVLVASLFALSMLSVLPTTAAIKNVSASTSNWWGYSSYENNVTVANFAAPSSGCGQASRISTSLAINETFIENSTSLANDYTWAFEVTYNGNGTIIPGTNLQEWTTNFGFQDWHSDSYWYVGIWFTQTQGLTAHQKGWLVKTHTNFGKAGDTITLSPFYANSTTVWATGANVTVTNSTKNVIFSDNLNLPTGLGAIYPIIAQGVFPVIVGTNGETTSGDYLGNDDPVIMNQAAGTFTTINSNVSTVPQDLYTSPWISGSGCNGILNYDQGTSNVLYAASLAGVGSESLTQVFDLNST